MKQKKFLTILNYEVGEVNIYEMSEDVFEKYLTMNEEDFIKEIVGLNPDTISWLITCSEPYITNEVLTLD